MVNTDNTNNVTMFGGQTMTPEQFAAFSQMAVEQAEQRKKLAETEKKAIADRMATLKNQSEAELKAKKLREANEKTELEALELEKKNLEKDEAEKERKRKLQQMRDEQEREYDDNRLAEWEAKKKRKQELSEKEQDVEKVENESLANRALKNSAVLDVLPDKIQNVKPEDYNKEEDNKNERKGFLSDMLSYNKQIMDSFKTPKNQEDGEQKNLGEKIQRVSFHPEGIKILRTLLDPIYKQLNAFTGDMDKGLKNIIDKMGDMFGSKSSGIGKILLLLLSDLLFMSGKLQQFFKFLGESSSRLYTAFEEMFIRLYEGFKAYGKAFKRFLFDEPLNILERLGLNIRKVASDSFEFVVEKFIKLKDGIIKNLKLEEMGQGIAELFNITIVEPFNNIKNVMSEFFQNRITKPITDFIERGRNIGKSLESFFEPLIKPFKEFSNIFKSGEGEGVFSRVVSSFGRVMEFSKNFIGPIQNLFKLLEPLLNVLKPFIGIIEGLAKFVSVEVISVIMGVVEAVKTFFDVWKDDKLSFFQKAVSVIAGFFGGVGSLLGDTIKAISSIISFIPGTGWITKGLNAVANAVDTSHLGKDTANAFRDYNQSQNATDNKDVWKSGTKYQNASPEEKKKMEEQHAAIEHKGQHFMPQGKGGKGIWVDDEPKNAQTSTQNQSTLKPEVKPATPAVVAEPAPVTQQYQPAPVEVPNPSQDGTSAKQMQDIINKNHIALQKTLMTWASNGISNTGNTTIVNQNQQVAKHDDSKDYLTHPTRDTNYDKKNSWYNNSLYYRASLP
jgi:hypothetical protein